MPITGLVLEISFGYIRTCVGCVGLFLCKLLTFLSICSFQVNKVENRSSHKQNSPSTKCKNSLGNGSCLSNHSGHQESATYILIYLT